MNIFKQNQSEEYTIIVGCGRLGASIADAMSVKHKNVLVIDQSKESFRKLSPHFEGLMIIGDATAIDVLREANINKATHVIAVTDNDNTNVMVAQMAKELFDVNHVIARLYDADRLCILQNKAIETICPVDLSIQHLNEWIKTENQERLS